MLHGRARRVTSDFDALIDDHEVHNLLPEEADPICDGWTHDRSGHSDRTLDHANRYGNSRRGR